MSGRLTGAAVVAGVAGQPVRHSLSPLLHNTWIAAAGLDAVYVPFAPADAAGFEALVAAGRAGMLRGLNVTAPFKTAALSLADQADEAARRCGSANLLLFVNGRVSASSTDGAGLMAALAEQAPQLDLTGRAVAVLGAGGAARAAVAALLGAGAGEVRIVNRSLDRAGELAGMDGRASAWSVDRSALALEGAALVVNAASGGEPPDLTPLPGGAVVMDMAYRPLRTPLLGAAQARGLATVDGLAMLIGQACPSFEAIFGIPPPPDDVRAAALAALEAAP